MSALDQLHITDLRPLLPRANWYIGTRPGQYSSATIHYNGPPIAHAPLIGEALIAQLVFDARFHMRPGALGAARGGDGIQYHFAIDGAGVIYQCRDVSAELWHCKNPTGNRWSVSLQFAIGGAQDVTEAQWSSGVALLGALMIDGSFERNVIRGHQDWPGAATQCPGPNLMRRLRAWRAGSQPPLGAGVYHILSTVPQANVRQEPNTQSKIAGVMWPGDTLVLGKAVAGERVGGSTTWGWRADGLGFVHSSLFS